MKSVQTAAITQQAQPLDPDVDADAMAQPFLTTIPGGAAATTSGGPAVPADVLPHDPVAAAKAAHLRYVGDHMPGIRRERNEDGTFRYIDVHGDVITDEKTLARIKSLGIPPAYTDVWICPISHGHLQATGRDARGRKQYRYHARWREVRDATKYDRMLAFGDALPRIRERVERDLARPGLPREKVLATIVRLLEKTRIRVGNEEYAQSNDSYGLTTLRNDHVDVQGQKLHFHFRGKHGKEHRIDLKDARVAKIVAKLHELDGQELFQWVDPDGTLHHITSGDVNAYLQEISGGEFTAKDFRTWGGTVLAALCLATAEAAESQTKAKHAVAEAIRQVSQRLGNTPAICRKCYVHPTVLDSYMDGSMARELVLSAAKDPAERNAIELTPEESAVLSFLRARLQPGTAEEIRKVA
jgi:DNA topoisomerase-1